MSLFFELPSSLQLEIFSSWLDFPQILKNLVSLDGAISNKASRPAVKELYESLNWDEFFSFRRYLGKHDPAPKIRWVVAREIRFRVLKLSHFQTDSKVFEEFMKANGKFLKEITLCETKSSMTVLMKYIAAHCTVLETLSLDRCNITQPLALVLKKCTTLTELRLRAEYCRVPEIVNTLGLELVSEKKSIFTEALCPNVRKLAVLHPISTAETAAVVAAFPNVTELELAGFMYSQPVPLALNAWRQLEVVALKYPHSGTLITEGVCAALEHSAPTLRKLTFCCGYDKDTFALPALAKLLTKCVKLVDIRFETDAVVDVITVIAECCGARLLHLRTPDKMPFTPAAAAAIAAHCPNLRTLYAASLTQCPDHALILEKCTQLEYLQVALARAEPDAPQSRALLQNIALHCRNMQQVVFRYYPFLFAITEEELVGIVVNNKKLHTIGVDYQALHSFPGALLSKVKFVNFQSCLEPINF